MIESFIASRETILRSKEQVNSLVLEIQEKMKPRYPWILTLISTFRVVVGGGGQVVDIVHIGVLV